MTDLDKAREEWEQFDHCGASYGEFQHVADALIAASSRDVEVRINAELRERIRQAEASLAAERERRCDECESREGSSHYCLLWTINTPDEHYCRDWTARDSGGGAS